MLRLPVCASITFLAIAKKCFWRHLDRRAGFARKHPAHAQRLARLNDVLVCQQVYSWHPSHLQTPMLYLHANKQLHHDIRQAQTSWLTIERQPNGCSTLAGCACTVLLC